jgi:hypothetical protein
VCGAVASPSPVLAHAAGLSRTDQKTPDQGKQRKDTPLEEGSAPKIASITLTEKEWAWLRAHPVITVVQDPGWPPIEFSDDHGVPSGITSDYVRIIEARLGVDFRHVRGLSWQDAYAKLKRPEINLTTSVAVTAERERFWTFTKP